MILYVSKVGESQRGAEREPKRHCKSVDMNSIKAPAGRPYGSAG